MAADVQATPRCRGGTRPLSARSAPRTGTCEEEQLQLAPADAAPSGVDLRMPQSPAAAAAFSAAAPAPWGTADTLGLDSTSLCRQLRRHHMDAALAAVPELTDDDRRKLHNCELLLATLWPPAVAAGTAAQDTTVWHAMSTRQSSCLEGHNQPLHVLLFSFIATRRLPAHLPLPGGGSRDARVHAGAGTAGAAGGGRAAGRGLSRCVRSTECVDYPTMQR